MNFSTLMRGFAIAGLVLGLTASASVHAQSLQGPIQNSVDQDGSGANSGGEGSNRILRRNVSENRALTGLVLAERSDDPCHLTTRFRRISNNQFFAGTGGMFDCGGSDGTGTNRSREQIDLPTNYFAEGVRVCLNSAGTKIKGVQIIGTRIDCINLSVPDQQADPTCKAFAHFERRNCVGSDSGLPDADWVAAAACPLQHYAIGVQLSTRAGGGNRRMIDGIGLKCGRVVQ